YASEDAFHRLPVHWMWWPAIGGIIIGLGGLVEPRALGVGYDVIRQLLRGQAPMTLILGILIVKTLIWSVSLGSGTSGGVLAPVFMIGGALGALEAHLFTHVAPGFWSLVGLAAVVGGVMRSPFTGVIFSLELTHEWGALLPLVISASSAYGVSVLLLKRSVLTEKIARRDMHLTRDYSIDPLEVLFVRDVMCTDVIYFRADTEIADAATGFVDDRRDRRDDLHMQRLYPVLDAGERLIGVVTRRDMLAAALDGHELLEGATLADLTLPEPVVTHSDITLREAANFIAEQGVTRLPVVDREEPDRLLGMVTLVDLLAGRLVDLQEERDTARVFRLRPLIPRHRPPAGSDPVGASSLLS
ncbi:MAG: chloride channel protein, partial [Acidobacteriota bacterium]|nr:chloride channel protein [Acidobacteriota bacterium]